MSQNLRNIGDSRLYNPPVLSIKPYMMNTMQSFF